MNFRILSIMQVCFIYLFISFNLNGQVDKDSSIYKMDSFYMSIQKTIDSDTTPNSFRLMLTGLNKAAYLSKSYSKEDTFFKYIKFVYDRWPHEAYYHNFVNDIATTKHINKVYPMRFPYTYKYMIHIRDSIEKTYDKSLQEKLNQLFTSDQKDRLIFNKLLARANISNNTIKEEAEKIDQNDLYRINQIDSIIKIHGYPGKSLVGLKYSHYALFIIQHSQSNELIKYKNVLENAVKKGDLSKGNFALFIDRLLIGTNRRQLFGTQYEIINGEILIFPIGNPEQLDERRINFGFIRFEDELKCLQKDLKKN